MLPQVSCYAVSLHKIFGFEKCSLGEYHLRRLFLGARSESITLL